MALKSGVLTPEVCKQLVYLADQLKALSYWLRVNLRKLVGLHIKVSVII